MYQIRMWYLARWRDFWGNFSLKNKWTSNQYYLTVRKMSTLFEEKYTELKHWHR
jgi:hypothetical protein